MDSDKGKGETRCRRAVTGFRELDNQSKDTVLSEIASNRNEDGWQAYLGRIQGSGWSWQRVPGAERICRLGPVTALTPVRAPPRRIGPRTQAPLESPT